MQFSLKEFAIDPGSTSTSFQPSSASRPARDLALSLFREDGAQLFPNAQVSFATTAPTWES